MQIPKLFKRRTREEEVDRILLEARTPKPPWKLFLQGALPGVVACTLIVAGYLWGRSHFPRCPDGHSACAEQAGSLLAQPAGGETAGPADSNQCGLFQSSAERPRFDLCSPVSSLQVALQSGAAPLKSRGAINPGVVGRDCGDCKPVFDQLFDEKSIVRINGSGGQYAQ